MDIRVDTQPDGSVILEKTDWKAPGFERLARAYSRILQAEVTLLDPDEIMDSGYSGFKVKTLNGFYVEVAAMLVNWRLMLVPVGVPSPVAERYWCFAGRDGASLARAMGQAALFDGSPDWAPEGFIRAWDRDVR